MISLTSNQPMFTESEWLVSTGGDYQPDDLVEVYRASDPEQTIAYYAQFISNGEYPS